MKGGTANGPVMKGGKAVQHVTKFKPSDVNSTVVRTGTVTSVRWDGTVNLQLGGQRFPAVACSASYINRASGDRVQVLVHGGMPFVIGEIGQDPGSPAPEIFPNDQGQYTWGYQNTTGREIRLYVNEGQDQRVGRPGSLRPTYLGDSYYQVAYSYWDGSQNVMVTVADLTQQIDIFFGRSDWDEGDPGPAYLSLWPQKGDLLPIDPQNIQLGAVDPPNIDFTLEAGELKVITLPDSWRDNIGATTPDSNTIRGFLVRPAAVGSIPYAVDNSYAILNSISGALRIYSQ
jgi:hypothetical protein